MTDSPRAIYYFACGRIVTNHVDGLHLLEGGKGGSGADSLRVVGGGDERVCTRRHRPADRKNAAERVIEAQPAPLGHGMDETETTPKPRLKCG